jgi:hypothetical protein
MVVRQQYGCETILAGSRERSDLLKATASDAIKKAISLLGPGFYLSIKEERVVIEQAIQAAVRAAIEEANRAQSRPKAGTSSPPKSMPSSEAGGSSQVAASNDAPETTGQRWARLVAEAEQAKLSTLGMVKAIDPKACGESQMVHYCELLEERLADAKQPVA